MILLQGCPEKVFDAVDGNLGIILGVLFGVAGFQVGNFVLSNYCTLNHFLCFIFFRAKPLSCTPFFAQEINVFLNLTIHRHIASPHCLRALRFAYRSVLGSLACSNKHKNVLILYKFDKLQMRTSEKSLNYQLMLFYRTTLKYGKLVMMKVKSSDLFCESTCFVESLHNPS